MPTWVEVLEPKNCVIRAQLDPGESEAIALAIDLKADLLLIDEQAGRQEALRRGLRVAGTLAVIDEAAQAGLADFENALAALQNTSFRLSRAVLSEIMQKRALKSCHGAFGDDER